MRQAGVDRLASTEPGRGDREQGGVLRLTTTTRGMPQRSPVVVTGSRSWEEYNAFRDKIRPQRSPVVVTGSSGCVDAVH